MSDCLIVSSTVDWMPYISATYFLATYPQEQCNGGNPAILVDTIEKYGAVDATCIDYSWCKNDPACFTMSAENHFDTSNLSTKIPDPGCYFENNKYVYYINKGSSKVISLSKYIPLESLRSIVKSHIYNYGPVIGGFLVLGNFKNGLFTQINDGVYFERADYRNISDDGKISFTSNMLHRSNNAGGHAISIVGWGIAKNIQYDNDKRGDVPYWHCRNSWGEEWGDNGYFKIAMYPFNKKVQFEQMITANIGGYLYQLGGIILFKTTLKPKIYKISEISDSYKNYIIPSQNNEFYNFNVETNNKYQPIPRKIHNAPQKRNSRNSYILWLIVILIIAFIA
jgi:hypothetical protein